MKKNLYTILILSISLIVGLGQTNCVSTNQAKEFGAYELTLGGGGTHINGNNEFGLDISLSTNPLKQRPEIWFGIAQGLYWAPTISGSTDLFADWSQNIWKEKLYANIGWSVGTVYDKVSNYSRTGPELTFQYYTSDNAFIFAGVNYDVWLSNNTDREIRYSFGIGIHW